MLNLSRSTSAVLIRDARKMYYRIQWHRKHPIAERNVLILARARHTAAQMGYFLTCRYNPQA